MNMTQMHTQAQTIEDDKQKIKMHAGDARRALSSLASALARLASLTHNPAFWLLSKTADTWREELDNVVK